MGVRTCLLLCLGLLVLCGVANAALLNPSATSNGCSGSKNYSDCYEELVNNQSINGNVTRIVAGAQVVPWYGSSTQCGVTDLKSGASCNIGTVDFTNYCIVSDEESVRCLSLSNSRNETGFNQCYNFMNLTVVNSGTIPAWRILANESNNTLSACDSRVNSNCDTASDATARYIRSCFTASNNTAFTNTSQRQLYWNLGKNMTRDMLQYEIVNHCYNSTQGYGSVCYWLAAGTGAKNGGMGATDFGYTGYYADATIAFLQACSQTGNMTYCAVAGNITLNYLQAANYSGLAFSVPPGRSFKWINISGGNTTPVASCTNTCSPDQWDAADAPRAFGMCEADYYAHQIGVTLPLLTGYCKLWNDRYMMINNSLPVQYFWNGTASAANQSGYNAQGLQSLALTSTNQSGFETTLRSALGHYSTSNKWDTTACFGVYNQGAVMRALSIGMGRDLASFPNINTSSGGGGTSLAMVSARISPSSAVAADTLVGYCNATSGGEPVNYNVTWFVNGNNIAADTAGKTIGECFQESSNVATACGAVSTGVTPDTGFITTWGEPGPGYLNMTYKKPPQASFNNTRWSVKHGALSTYNITLPFSCWNASSVNLTVRISSTDNGFVGSTQPQCLNSTGWQNVGTADSSSDAGHGVGGSGTTEGFDGSYSTYLAYNTQVSRWVNSIGSGGAGGKIYEEAMLWNITGISAGVETNLVNESNRQKGDQLIVSCQVTNGTSTTAWLNSSTLTIGNTAPVNNWSGNNATFNHNASILIGGFCSDADVADTLVYSTNSTLFPILDNGSINYTANLSRTGIQQLNVSCSDSTANTTVTTTLNITNTLPNVTGVNLTPLPAQAGLSLNITYACGDLDNDVCNSSVFYAWFKNGVLNTTITGKTLGAGNFTTGDNITGSVRVYDGNLNSSWLNTSTATIGDNTPPVIAAFGLSATSLTTADTLTVGATCTDNNQVGTVTAEVTDPQSNKANFTMTGANNTYTVAYPPPLAGTYSVKVFCTDGNGNVANTTSIAFTVSLASSSGSNSGSGGGAGLCSFVLLQPVTRIASNPLCPTGGTSQDLTISVQNNLLASTAFHLEIPQQRCTSVPETLTLGGGQKGVMTLTNCSCPTVAGREDDVNISVVQANSVCSQQFTLQLTGSDFGGLVQNPAALLIGFGTIFFLGIAFIFVVAAIAKRAR